MQFERPKLVFVTGGVMSGLGKGVTVSSLAKLLSLAGYDVSCIKIDPYLNVDAGTMNPLAHGEVFVTDDGGECDMDIGTYERFLAKDLGRSNNMTTGQVYQKVISQEREGRFLGSCVQIIPHITDEIKRRIRSVAKGLDVLLVECGGTVGDIESLPFLEAFRQMAFEADRKDTFFAHVTLAPILETVGEVKTKPTQHSVQELRRIGIQPDALVVRARKRLTPEAKRKMALFTSVPERAVISNPDVPTVYSLPEVLYDEGIMDAVSKKMEMPARVRWGGWKKVAASFGPKRKRRRVAMVGKYATLGDSYASVNQALLHAAGAHGVGVDIDWIESEGLKEDALAGFDGIVLPQGFGTRGTEGKMMSANYAREKDVPFLGLCFGFQLAVVSFARHVCGLAGANSTEIDPETQHPVIDLLPEQRGVREMGATMRLGGHDIAILEGTKARTIYRAPSVRRRHRHRYEVNPAYRERLEAAGLRFSAFSDGGRRAEILECPEKRFYMATQFHPEYSSRPGDPERIFSAFVGAML
ncbi:MAG: CTP synthase [Nitrososphaerota archaeon]|nr:CTP synthase [Nitrososphaerota archaeon]MDG6939430.1 CTP synthase [Nitrososphaerota archaeon]